MRKISYYHILFFGLLLLSCGKDDSPKTAKEKEPLNITLDKTNLELHSNDTATLVATITGDTNSKIIWSSNNKEILEVDNQGNLTAIQQGSATISATIDEKKATCAVTVNPNIYVVGFERNGETDVVKLWTNGISEELPNAGNARSVFVSGTDIYVAGRNKNDQAAFWKNGIITTLSNSSNYSEGYSIFVENDDVYVAGYEKNEDVNIAKVWKNEEVIYDLTDGTKCAWAFSIFVKNANIFAAGYECQTGNSFPRAKIWENGVRTDLTNGMHQSRARSVFVSGAKIYVGGQEFDGDNHVAKLWENGIATNLTDNSIAVAEVFSIFVDKSDIFAVGFQQEENGYVAMLWKNGAPIPLTDGSSTAFANSVYVSGDDAFIAGYFGSTATIWKNENILYHLNNGSNLAIPNSIFVK